MKQVAVLSAKGGTGKTAVTLALAAAAIAESRSMVLADGDVEGTGLTALLPGQFLDQGEVGTATGAAIDPALCNACGACCEVCQFDAVAVGTEGRHFILDWACCGCAACAPACPTNAIRLDAVRTGTWQHARTPLGELFSARLEPARDGAAELVTAIRQRACRFAVETHADYILIDGPAGVGKAPIAACAGADLALLVAEPGLAGKRALERILALADLARVSAAVVVNRADAGAGQVDGLDDAGALRDLPLLGRVPFDPGLAQAMRQQLLTPFAQDGPFMQAMIQVWDACRRLL